MLIIGTCFLHKVYLLNLAKREPFSLTHLYAHTPQWPTTWGFQGMVKGLVKGFQIKKMDMCESRERTTNPGKLKSRDPVVCHSLLSTDLEDISI